MAKSVILAVDDDPQVLAAVARDLRARYGRDYALVRAGSGEEALEALDELRASGDTVALFVVDQRMPHMTGTEFLAQAKPHFPAAKTVLLTAYADTDAAIEAINEVDLDHYLLKPWAPPEERLYPIVDELLDDWVAANPPPYSGVRVIDTRWSPHGHEIKDFLARNRVPYRFYDMEKDPEARSMVEAAQAELPMVVLSDGTTLSQPDVRSLASAVGLQVEAKGDLYDLVVVGAGPAGLGAGVYAASEGLRTALIERAATGGQAGTSSRIENYLGFPSGISGSELARRASSQALRFGAEILTGPEVLGVEVGEPVKTVILSDGRRVETRAVVVASGMSIRRLGVESVEALVGAGVYYGAAPSEAAAYRDEHVYVVGGANSAGQAAMMLSTTAARVTVILRGTSLGKRMSQYLVDRIESAPNIDVVLRSHIVRAEGEGHLEKLVLADVDTEEETTVATSGLFIFIGAAPHSDFLDGVVRRSSRGFILTGPDLQVEGQWPPEWPLERDPYPLETSVPGIFAAGDVREGAVRRVATAVGQGAVAVTLVHQYLATI